MCTQVETHQLGVSEAAWPGVELERCRGPAPTGCPHSSRHCLQYWLVRGPAEKREASLSELQFPHL